MSTTTNTERIMYSIELDELVRRIADEVERRMRDMKRNTDADSSTQSGADALLNRVQAAKLLGITVPTLREYTRRGHVTGYRLGSRVRYKRSELVAGMERMRYAKELKQ